MKYITTVTRRKPLTAVIGVVGVGHHVYWNQFEGLLDKMKEKHFRLIQRIQRNEIQVVDFGMIDEAQIAYQKVWDIKRSGIDLLFIDMLTYATSSTIGIIFREIKVPMVMVAIQPLPAMDYENGTTFMQLWNDDICALPEFAGVALRITGKIPEIIIGTQVDDPGIDRDIQQWCQIAKVLHDLPRARIGHMGHVLESMLDMHTDATLLTSTFGVHVVQCEPDDLMKHWHRGETKEVVQMKKRILDFFDIPDSYSDPITEKLTPEDLQLSAEIAVALEYFIEEKNLDGLAYYYEGEENSLMRVLMSNLIVGNSLLISSGFPMCGEYDIKTCIAMLIMDRLGMGGSFAEFHPVDFTKDTVLIGHDGPHHLNIADAKPILRSLKQYHGKPGRGASVEFSIRNGPITILSIGINAQGKCRLVIAEGESIKGPIPPTGNTNTHGKFSPDVRTFLKRWIQAGPTHHFALGVGHQARVLQTVATLLGIESVVVT